MQLESYIQTTNKRMERIEEDTRVMMGFLMGSPQMSTSLSIGFIHFVDARGKKHPVLMNMASSFEVCCSKVMYHYPEIILTVTFSNSMTLFERYFNRAVPKARRCDDIWTLEHIIWPSITAEKHQTSLARMCGLALNAA